MITFLRVNHARDKRAELLSTIVGSQEDSRDRRFVVDPASFSLLPGSPFAYWVSDEIKHLFQKLDPFEGEGRTAKQGLSTANDFRFLRGWWEICPKTRARWKSFVKGGVLSPFYGSIPLTVNWAADGVELKAFASHYRSSRGWGDQWSAMLNSTDFYFRPGLSWPLRGSRFSARAISRGCIFSVGGKMAFVPGDILGPWLALFNSGAFDQLVMLFAGTARGVQYEAGLIQRVIVPRLTSEVESALSSLARRAWSLKHSLDTKTETSHAFALPALLQVDAATLKARAQAWAERVLSVEAELSDIQQEIDDLCFDLYGINETDRESIIQGFQSSPEDDSEVASSSEDEEDGAETTTDPTSLVAELVSWAVGVAFGRFDVRLVTGDRALPDEPEPFDPLPVCSPGMLTGDNGLPLEEAPVGYPFSFPISGVLVDDPGHSSDLTASVRKILEAVFGDGADQLWQEASTLLDPKGADMRKWLAKGFSEHHLKEHSKSRRKAPILWQLAIPSGSYSIWIYAYRATKDSLFQVLNDFLKPKLLHEERKLTELRDETADGASARQRKGIAAQESFVEELRVLKENLDLVSGLWDPDLNDGVMLTLAPLWELVPHKPWQKELKKTWQALCAGTYDWAHIAMHLWPERVVPKCAIDRSLAIAHGLEDIFWTDEEGKWQKRDAPTEPIEDLIKVRTSAAVKAALTRLS